MAHRTIHPEGWNAAKGYANGILTDDGQLFIGGQIGWNAQHEFESDDFIAQMTQALQNVAAVVHAAGGETGDIVRLTWYVTDKTDYLAHQKEVGAVYRSVLGRHFPAMTMVVVDALIEDRAVVEIEATAVLKPERGPR